MYITELVEIENKATLVDALRDFLPIAVSHLKLNALPKFNLEKTIGTSEKPTFGHYDPANNAITIAIANRQPVDIIRTLAHELTHFKQESEGKLHPQSGETGSNEEDEANAEAGVMLREFSQKYPKYLTLDAVLVP